MATGHYWYNVRDCMEGRAYGYPEGMSLDEAIKLVAKSFHVTERTIRKHYNEGEKARNGLS